MSADMERRQQVGRRFNVATRQRAQFNKLA